MQYALSELWEFKYQRDCWQLGFAYAALLGNAQMACDCAVLGTESTICSLLYCALRQPHSANEHTYMYTHTHTHTHTEPQPLPTPAQTENTWLSFHRRFPSQQEIQMSQVSEYSQSGVLRFFMGNCEVQVAREPAIASCKATQHGGWVIMTDGISQKKKN